MANVKETETKAVKTVRFNALEMNILGSTTYSEPGFYGGDVGLTLEHAEQVHGMTSDVFTDFEVEELEYASTAERSEVGSLVETLAGIVEELREAEAEA